MNHARKYRHGCLLAVALVVPFSGSGCGREAGVDSATATNGVKIDIGGTRKQADQIQAELKRSEPSETRFREIVDEIHQLEQRPELTDMELSDLRQAAASRWGRGNYGVTPEYRELQASVGELGGDFGESPLTGAVLAHFQDASISDDDLEKIKGLEHVTTLVLWGVGDITDRAMQFVAEACPNLRVLDIRGTQVTDAGLVPLERIDTLRKVVTAGSAVSDAGAARMQAVLQPRVDEDTAARKARSQRHRQLRQ